MPEPRGLLNKKLNLIVKLLLIIAIISFVATNFTVFKNIMFSLIGIGLVIIIHELGHFSVAKFSGIKVEAFSIGFPPILLTVKRTEKGFVIKLIPKVSKEGDIESESCLYQFTIGKKAKPGETEYRIGLIPFGGFVKMLGQEDTKEVGKSDDPRSYANKPVWIRMAVIAAGVTSNVISAVIIFMVVFLIGIKQMPAVVGGVRPDSPAAKAGLVAGDEVISINGETRDLQFMNLAMAATMAGPNEPVELKVKHLDNSTAEYSIVPVASKQGGLKAFGIFSPLTLEISKVDDPNEMLAQTGLLPGDVIKAVGGQDIQNYLELEKITASALNPQVAVLADRINPETNRPQPIHADIKLTLNLRTGSSLDEKTLGNLCSMVPRLKIVGVTKDNNLKTGDVIVRIAETDNPTYKQMRDIVANFDKKPLDVGVIRKDEAGKDQLLTITTIPEKNKEKRVVIGIGLDLDVNNAVVAKTTDPNNGFAKLDIPDGATITAVDGIEVSNFFDIARIINQNSDQKLTIDYRLNDEIAGDVMLDLSAVENFKPIESVFQSIIPFEPLERLYKATGPVNAIAMGYRSTEMFIVNSYQTLKSLIFGYVSPKYLSGPVGIVTMSYRIIKDYPLVYYMNFIGLISACIAVFNALPLLPFDGGHIVFLAIEKIKGSPVNEKVQMYFLYAGLAAVLAFALYITFNDLRNLIDYII